MSAANRKRSGWGQATHADAPTLGVGTLYTTSREQDEATATRLQRGANGRNKAFNRAMLGSTHSGKGDGAYDPRHDLCAPVPRPGSDAFLLIPSRHGDRLNYRDGTVVFLNSPGNQP
jgi:hypothetical protein